MKRPPAVMVHGLAQARAALAPALPVTLLSAPGAGLYAGAGWWLAVIAAARGGQTAPAHILDCGSGAGRALEAARAGQPLLVLRADAAIFTEVAAIAASYGAAVLAAPPDSLDLAWPGAEARLVTWLRSARSG